MHPCVCARVRACVRACTYLCVRARQEQLLKINWYLRTYRSTKIGPQIPINWNHWALLIHRSAAYM